MIYLLALYPFGGATLLPFLTGHNPRLELALIAVFWPACWALIAVMMAGRAYRVGLAPFAAPYLAGALIAL